MLICSLYCHWCMSCMHVMSITLYYEWNEMSCVKCYVLPCKVMWWITWSFSCIHDAYMKYVMSKRRKEMKYVILWMKIMEPHACMYVMCIGIPPYYVILVRTRIFDTCSCHDIMRAFSFLMRSVTCNVLCPIKRIRIRARLVGPCVRMWAVCGEAPCIQPCLELKSAQGHVTCFKWYVSFMFCVWLRY